MDAHQLPSDPCTVIFLQRKPHKAQTLGIFRSTHSQRRMLSFNAAGVSGGHSFKECEFATDEEMVPGPERSSSLPRTASSRRLFCTKRLSLTEMDPETEFTIQTRFEKYAEFVALQNQALSLDISSQAFNEESNRQIKLMQDMVNIVR